MNLWSQRTLFKLAWASFTGALVFGASLTYASTTASTAPNLSVPQMVQALLQQELTESERDQKVIALAAALFRRADQPVYTQTLQDLAQNAETNRRAAQVLLDLQGFWDDSYLARYMICRLDQKEAVAVFTEVGSLVGLLGMGMSLAPAAETFLPRYFSVIRALLPVRGAGAGFAGAQLYTADARCRESLPLSPAHVTGIESALDPLPLQDLMAFRERREMQLRYDVIEAAASALPQGLIISTLSYAHSALQTAMYGPLRFAGLINWAALGALWGAERAVHTGLQRQQESSLMHNWRSQQPAMASASPSSSATANFVKTARQLALFYLQGVLNFRTEVQSRMGEFRRHCGQRFRTLGFESLAYPETLKFRLSAVREEFVYAQSPLGGSLSSARCQAEFESYALADRLLRAAHPRDFLRQDAAAYTTSEGRRLVEEWAGKLEPAGLNENHLHELQLLKRTSLERLGRHFQSGQICRHAPGVLLQALSVLEQKPQELVGVARRELTWLYQTLEQIYFTASDEEISCAPTA